jgi:hypothetical protein
VDSEDEMIPFTVNEIRRLWAVSTAPRHARRHTQAWSHWRRRRQYQAKRSHYQRRLKDPKTRL